MMPGNDKEIILRLIIDGKEAITTLKLTEAEINKLNSLVSEVGDEFDANEQSAENFSKTAADGIDEVDDNSKKLNSTFKDTAKQLLVWVGLASVIRGAFNFLIDSKNIARDAAEIQSKFNTVFGNLSIEANAWAESFGKTVGRAKSDVKSWMVELQDTFVPLGFARAKASQLSESLVKLAVDVASFNDTSDPQVIKDFASALVGNHEPVRQYGILITENSLKQEALRQGIDKNFASLTDLEKVQLRYNIILNSTTDAQGNAIRTADSLANTEKRRAAELKDMQEVLGDKVAPAFLLVTQATIGWFGTLNNLLGVQQEVIDKTQVQATQLSELKSIYEKYPKDFEKYKETLLQDTKLRLSNAQAILGQAMSELILAEQKKKSLGLAGVFLGTSDEEDEVNKAKVLVETFKTQLGVIKNFDSLTQDDGGNGDPTEEAKQKYIKDLQAKQTHEENMLKLETDNDLLMLKLKAKHYEELLAAYKKFGIDEAEIRYKIAENRLEFEKKSKPPEISIDEPTDEILPDVKFLSEQELFERKEKLRINAIDNEFERQRALAQFDKNLNLEKYKDYENYSTIKVFLEAEASEKIKRINKSEADYNKKLEEQKTEQQIEGVRSSLNFIGAGVGKYTLFGKAIAAFQAGINVSEAATKALTAGPVIGPILAAMIITLGAKQVNDIISAKPPKFEGFESGGILRKGKTGFIEGTGNEIIAPEKDFVEVFQQELRPRIYNNSSSVYYDLSGVKESINKLNKHLDEGIKARAYLNDREAKKIESRGRHLNNKTKL